ncbi:metal ABC transporter ATP-binding protein [Sutcliffiella horikoshii]|uniref:Metal ABC transporter ATP-binding protein n=1 Tax=Sutcliffiella horikoshii TaxID=79883 RepID=A0A5D4T2U2_9BACI|nr:metal ABC transporter ATP-binding protein [Sutcliffiella horikoshii]TYS68762.1 metal ABC transporter ATP-binding protein [Sutcliffiella horikoshii]
MKLEKVLEIKGLSYKYEKQNVIENINLSLPKGAFLGLVGPNGSGKSTLLKCILGLLRPQKGSIELFGKDIRKFKDWSKIGFVSQKANSFNSGFPATVFEVVSTGLVSKVGLLRFFNKQHKKQVLEAIRAVGMEDFTDRNIGDLSGGQQQRVFIARALVSEPDLLILDEPTVGVDIKNVQNFYSMLSHLNKKLGITLILVTHDVGTITEKVTHVACLNKHLHFHGVTDEFEKLRTNDLSQFYGHDVHVLSHDHHHHDGGHM